MADGTPAPKGLYCPSCRGVRLTVRVIYKRRATGVYIRYRECSACGCRFKTREHFVHVTRRPKKKPID